MGGHASDAAQLRRTGRCFSGGLGSEWADELCQRARAEGLDADFANVDDVGVEVWVENHPACPHCGANGCYTCKFTGLRGGESPDPPKLLLRPLVWSLFRLNYWLADLWARFWGTRVGRFSSLLRPLGHSLRPFARLARRLGGYGWINEPLGRADHRYVPTLYRRWKLEQEWRARKRANEREQQRKWAEPPREWDQEMQEFFDRLLAGERVPLPFRERLPLGRLRELAKEARYDLKFLGLEPGFFTWFLAPWPDNDRDNRRAAVDREPKTVRVTFVYPAPIINEEGVPEWGDENEEREVESIPRVGEWVYLGASDGRIVRDVWHRLDPDESHRVYVTLSATPDESELYGEDLELEAE
jgi:hypothetical protein